MLLSLMFKSITFVSLYTQITSTMIGGGWGGGGRGARGRDRRGGRWIRSRAGRGHRVVGANQRSQLQDEDGNLMMDDLERDTQGGKIR